MAMAELNADEMPVFVAAVSDARPTDRTPLRTSARSWPPRSSPSRPQSPPTTSPRTSGSSSRASTSSSGSGAASAAVPCLRDVLTADDWVARKVAAEALALLALEHGDDLVSHKSSCITVFEAKRFDKVKIVCESMNRLIEAWKEIPDLDEEVCSLPSSQSRSSLSGDVAIHEDTASDGRYPADSSGSTSSPSITRRNSWPTNRQPQPDGSNNAINRKGSPPSIVAKKNLPSSHRSTDQFKKFEDMVVVTMAPDATPIKMVAEEKLLKEGNVRERLEARRVLFQKTGDKGYKKVAGPKSGSRVVPYSGEGDGVTSCYDEGKRVVETLMFDYHRQHGIEIRIARIFNTYGPRMNIDDGCVVSNFIDQAVR
ncbi:hypothetical protein ZEAMMB73_Zm00001d036320 [Zea mays]|uniref:Uncharacterized protein n=1 Tax=Zea mays TaxID=4577 RepID=A0A1D6LLR7_MAIZE|nr:hypothetical protein ZEAMMB73_Zm00001d036320 [Zea mays]